MSEKIKPHELHVPIAKALDFDDAREQALKMAEDFFSVDRSYLRTRVKGTRVLSFYSCEVLVTYEDNPEEED